MNDPVIRFAELLFRENTQELAAVRAAIDQPASFITHHAKALGLVRLKPGWRPDSWDLLLYVAQLRGWMNVVDWRADSDEVVACVKALPPAKAMAMDWDGITLKHSLNETRDFLRIIANEIPHYERLVSLDRGSDSYQLALLTAGAFPQAEEIAGTIGGRVDDLGE